MTQFTVVSLKNVMLYLISISALTIIVLRIKFSFLRRKSKLNTTGKIVAFFHPNCSDGGGGERVLWSAIAVLGKLYDRGIKFSVVVYTTDDLPQEGYQFYKDRIMSHVLSRFSISVSSNLPFQFVHLRKAEERKRSMIGQSVASMKLAYQALHFVTPDIFFDTTGCAFTFIIAKIFASCTIGAYIHYPTISTDMIALVFDRRPSYNNDMTIVTNPIRSYMKILYYSIFAICYGFVGSLCDIVMVNSSWTLSHISNMWIWCSSIQVIFPPCDTASLKDISISKREDIVISIGQFRPEKDHPLQLKAFSLLLKDTSFSHVRLILIGSCRDKSDNQRVNQLKLLSEELGIEDNVDFVLNQPYEVLKEWFGKASIGIHTMWNEHFGIGIVEMMAAGLLTIAHNSGGPKHDIIEPGKTGFLASTAEDYTKTLKQCLSIMNKQQVLQMRKDARESSFRFSDDVFASAFEKLIVSSSILS